MTDTAARSHNDVTEEELRSYQRTDDYRRDFAEDMAYAGKRVADAQAVLNQAEASRRVAAMTAVRAGHSKMVVANALGVSRPTLDAWLKMTGAEPEEMGRVRDHERFIKREIARGNVK